MRSVLATYKSVKIGSSMLLFFTLISALGCASNLPGSNSTTQQVATPTLASSSAAAGLNNELTNNESAIKFNRRETQYFIQPGDELDLKFFYNPELDDVVTVRPDGKIALQLLNEEIHVHGLTPAQLDDLLTRKYSADLRRPEVAVIVRSFNGRQVYVGGEVNSQGLLVLNNGMTALQAVVNAGGFNDKAKPESAIIIRRGMDNQPTPFRINLQKVIELEDPSADLVLQPYDIVYIPATPIAKLNQFVDQYIKKLLLFDGPIF